MVLHADHSFGSALGNKPSVSSASATTAPSTVAPKAVRDYGRLMSHRRKEVLVSREKCHFRFGNPPKNIYAQEDEKITQTEWETLNVKVGRPSGFLTDGPSRERRPPSDAAKISGTLVPGRRAQVRRQLRAVELRDTEQQLMAIGRLNVNKKSFAPKPNNPETREDYECLLNVVAASAEPRGNRAVAGVSRRRRGAPRGECGGGGSRRCRAESPRGPGRGDAAGRRADSPRGPGRGDAAGRRADSPKAGHGQSAKVGRSKPRTIGFAVSAKHPLRGPRSRLGSAEYHPRTSRPRRRRDLSAGYPRGSHGAAATRPGTIRAAAARRRDPVSRTHVDKIWATFDTA